MKKAEVRVAKNTLFLYARMLLSLLVSLYTSRVILKTLCFEDYGIYNLVGGLVALFAFMSSSLSGAASRFIAYSLGDGKDQAKNVLPNFSLMASKKPPKMASFGGQLWT